MESKSKVVPVIALLLALPACSSSDRDHPRPRSTATTRPSERGGEPVTTGVQTFTGTLQGNIAAAGAGGTKGWILAADQGAGGMALDVSKIADRARELHGKRVKVTGRMGERMLPTTGRTHVLIVDSIEPAPEPAR